jgi:hypothetical protein
MMKLGNWLAGSVLALALATAAPAAYADVTTGTTFYPQPTEAAACASAKGQATSFAMSHGGTVYHLDACQCSKADPVGNSPRYVCSVDAYYRSN